MREQADAGNTPREPHETRPEQPARSNPPGATRKRGEDTLEQGKYYDRLCVRTVWPSGIKRQWWPVLGPLHDDREILRFYQKHYHVDHRFLKLREKQESGDGMAVSPAFSIAIIRVWPDVPGCPGQGVDLDDLPDPRYPPQSYLRVMRRRLSSQYPTYPGTDRVPWLVPLHEAHAESELTAGPEGAICPHRGTPLAGLQADPEGCVQARSTGSDGTCGRAGFSPASRCMT